MSVKQGILHDYDLRANDEPVKVAKCDVCDRDNPSLQWSDYHGEAMCTRCGCPYQIAGGGEGVVYPRLNLRADIVPLAQEYWRLEHSFVHYGAPIGAAIGIPGFWRWVEQAHPEYIEMRRAEDAA